MELWHKSWMAEQIGTHLVPISTQAPDDTRFHRVCFHERRDIAERWGSGRVFGHTLYRVDSANVPDLEMHPQWKGVWWTTEPVPFDAMEVISHAEGGYPAGLKGMIEKAAVRHRTAPIDFDFAVTSKADKGDLLVPTRRTEQRRRGAPSSLASNLPKAKVFGQRSVSGLASLTTDL